MSAWGEFDEHSVLAVQYTPVSPRLGKDVGGFLNYIRERDVHLDKDRRLEGLIRYVANRDRSALRGLLFGPEGRAGELDCKHFAAYVKRSVRDWKPQLYRDKNGALVDARRAVSRFVLSPEQADGLDLQKLTLAMLKQLEQDAGGLPPWIAAEHRNTVHRHVHIVLASRRELSPGRFRTVKITRERLERMKQAMLREVQRQRSLQNLPVPTRSSSWILELEREAGALSPAATTRARTAQRRYLEPERVVPPASRQAGAVIETPEPVQVSRHRLRRAQRRPRPPMPAHPSLAAIRLRRLAAHYRREAELEAERWRHEHEQELDR